MKIAFVTFEYPPFINGGAGIYASNITRELSKLGHNVVVFAPDLFDEVSSPNVNNLEIRKVSVNKIFPFKALQFWLRLPAEIKRAERETKFDIVHFNSISYWFLKKRLSKAKHIVTVHHLVKDAIKNNNLTLFSRIKDVSGENSLFLPLIEKRCLSSADILIAVSQFTKDQIIKNYNISSQQIEVVYNGIDIDNHNFSEEDIKETKKKFGLENKIILLFVGRVDDPRKGLDTLLYAMKKILKNKDVFLLVVGKGDQGNARKLSEILKIKGNVIFTGFVDSNDLKKYYSLCDIYVCPSRLEGFGLTILEAMVAGKPIVATNVGAIPEIIGDYGLLVNPDNDSELCDAIIRSIDSELSLFKPNLNAIEKFSWERASKKLLSIYSRL
ncbi:glycosyltransferase family 4 protein [Methanosarcina thermophila]|uniref:Glycosyltransferase n=1 Tax=Methanosarcina thermophila CHTI-55 TaxID=1434121 RepID=A0A0E3NHI8_METTE|nr:glycosyltransferase family 4 protein [Methanosarcina thermophila]AKB16444.1 Glycosyltransferase [Methanosarcina thermophila CHTI-55]